MLYGYGIVGLAQVALLVYCALDVVTTPEDRVRGLPKPLWLLLVVVLPLAGPVAWLVAGRPRRAAPQRQVPPAHPDDDEEFLRELRRRADEQRRRAREEGEEPPA